MNDERRATRLLRRWGEWTARRRRVVILAAAAAVLLAAPGVWRAVSRLNADLFSQLGRQPLPRVRALRDASEKFGGELLFGVAYFPESELRPGQGKSGTGAGTAPALQNDKTRLSALKRFIELWAAELATVGTHAEDAAGLAPGIVPEGAWLRRTTCRFQSNGGRETVSLLEKYPQAALTVADVPALEALFEPRTLTKKLKAVRQALLETDPTFSAERARLRVDPLGLRSLLDKLRRRRMLRGGRLKTSADGFFISADCTTAVVIGRPARSSHHLDFARALTAACGRATIRAVRVFEKTPEGRALRVEPLGPFFPTEPQGPQGRTDEKEQASRLCVGFTGGIPTAVENELSLRRDLPLTTLSSLVGVLLIFFAFLRRLRPAFHLAATLLVGIVFTFAAAGLRQGGLGVIGAGFPCILVGMGIDYGIHYFHTFRNARLRCGGSVVVACGEASARCGGGILTAAATTAAAFFGLSFTHFAGLAELGFLSGCGIVVTAFLMLTLFPALLAGTPDAVDTTMKVLGRAPAADFTAEREGFFGRAARLLAGVAFACLCGWAVLEVRATGTETVAGVPFDSEFSHLRSRRIKAAPLRDRLAKKFGTSAAALRVLVSASDEAAALEAAAAARRRLKPFLRRGELRCTGDLSLLLPSPRRQAETLQRLRQLEPRRLLRAFDAAVEREFGPRGKKFFQPFRKRWERFCRSVENADEKRPLTTAALQKTKFASLLLSFIRRSENAADGRPVTLASYYETSRADRPESWYRRVAAAIEGEEREGGGAGAATVPTGKTKLVVTSPRMVGFELKETLFADMDRVCAMVGLLVAGVLFVAFRSLPPILLSLIPLLFGYLALLGGVATAWLSGWGLSLNYVNLIVFPVLLGSSVDYGIYLLSAARHGHGATAETKRSVFLCGLTTSVGFGSMIGGSFTGLISFGWCAVLGYGGALFGALIVLPAFIRPAAEKTTGGGDGN